MMKRELKYPVVFVHGMFGWGENEGIYKKMPYWGATTGSLTDYLRDKGYECYAASVGPISSAWDQACQLYAQLTGTQVDYGKAHSQRHNHKQFGRKYEKSLFEGWSEEKKVHLIGHSFGGLCIRMLSHLLAYGDPREVEASGDDVSPLFKGGNGKLIYSISAICSPLDAVDAYEVADKYNLYRTVRAGAVFYSCAMGRSPFNGRAVDFHLEHFGLTNTPGQKDVQKGHRARKYLRKKYKTTDENIFSGLKPEGIANLNDFVEIVPSIYYFSFPFNAVEYDEKKKKEIASKTDLPLMHLTGFLLLHNSRQKGVNKSGGNDGMVDVVAAFSPPDEPRVEYTSGMEYNSGIWHVMPVQTGDHGTAIGLLADKDETHTFYLNIMKLLKKVESKE